MDDAFKAFKANIARVRRIGGLHNYLSSQLTVAIDLSDLLRLQLSTLMSALDTYIHSVTLIGMTECFLGVRPKTAQYSTFQFNSEILHSYLDTKDIIIIRSYIFEKHSILSFQHPDKIAEALRLFYENNIWVEISKTLDVDQSHLKLELKNIYNRRNKIVHESDIDPTSGLLWPISTQDVEGAIIFIEDVVSAIHRTIR